MMSEDAPNPLPEDPSTPSLRERVLGNAKVKLIFICAGVILFVTLIALWLTVHHVSQTHEKYEVPPVSSDHFNDPPPPATAPAAALPDATAKKAGDKLNEPTQPATQQQQPAGFSPTHPDGVPATPATPEDDYKKKLKDFDLAADLGAPDARIDDAPTPPTQAPQPQAQAPSTQPESKPFPPVASREEEIGKEKLASYATAHGKLYRLFGGVDIIEARLDNQIAGEFGGQFTATVIADVWSQHHEAVLVPAGSKLIGRYFPVSDGQQARLMSEVGKLWMPDGWTITFDTTPIEDAAGETGIPGKVNHHYAQTFFSAIGIAAIGAGAQVGNYQYGYGYDPGVQLRNRFTQQMSSQALQEAYRHPRPLPTITIPTGTKVQLSLGNDLLLPDWKNHDVDPHI